MAGERLLRFRLGREDFALRLSDALHLAEVSAPAPVPLAPPEVAGVADVRGKIVTLLELSRLVGLPVPERRRWLAVLLAPPRSHLGLLVGNDVELLVTDLEGARELEAATGPAGRARPVRGLLSREGVLLNLIDPEAVAGACELRIRERFHAEEAGRTGLPGGSP